MLLGDNIASRWCCFQSRNVGWMLYFQRTPLYIHVQLTTCIHNSDLRTIRLTTELRNVSDSVTSATVCTVTMTGGETSDEGQTVERTVIEFIILMDCLYNMELVRECYLESTATRLVKKTRYKGSIETCRLQECQHYYY
jgi:hypothetical protein